MAYTDLKAAVAAIIKTNGTGAITGANTQQTLNAIINSLGEYATFAGAATPSTNPGIPDGNVIYMASEAGTYANFGALRVLKGISILYWDDGDWVSYSLGVDSLPSSFVDTEYSDALFMLHEVVIFDGTVISSSSVDTTDFLDCRGASKIITSSIVHSTPASYGIAFYDNNYNFLCMKPRSVGIGHSEETIEVNVPINASFFRASYWDTATQTTYALPPFSCLIKSVLTSASDLIANSEARINEYSIKKIGKNSYTGKSLDYYKIQESGKRFNELGGVVDSPTGEIGEFIPVSAGDKYVYSGEAGAAAGIAVVHGYTLEDFSEVAVKIVVSDSANLQSDSIAHAFSSFGFEIPSGVSYIAAWSRNKEASVTGQTLLVSKLPSKKIYSLNKDYYTIGEQEIVKSLVPIIGVTDLSTVQDVYDIYDNLVSLYPEYVSKSTLGQDGVGNNIYSYSFEMIKPILHNSSWTAINWDENINNMTLLINAGTHGNEKSAAFATATAMKLLCESSDAGVEYIRNNATIKVIAILNPSGFMANTRENSNGADINRDFNTDLQPETAIAKQFINDNLEAVSLMDIHNPTTDFSAFVILPEYIELKQIALPMVYSLKSNWLANTGLESSDFPFIHLVNAGSDTMKDYLHKVDIEGMSIEIIRTTGTNWPYDDAGVKIGVDLVLNTLSLFIKRNSN